MAQAQIIKTKVGIVGGGPAGLMLSHLLAKQGIDNLVVESRDHETIRNTHRAGILERGCGQDAHRHRRGRQGAHRGRRA